MRSHPSRTHLLTLAVVAACGGAGGDDSSGGSSTTAPPATAATAASSGDESTGAHSSMSTPSDAATAEAPTSAPDDTGEAPTTAASTGPDVSGTTADPGTGTTDATTGGLDPNDLPEIPDDGLPSSAHFKPVPLGASEALQGYWEYAPPGYGGGEPYPLLVFLHGIGENGNGVEELDKVSNAGIAGLIKYDQWPTDRPFVVLSPQHPNDGGCPGAAEVHDFIAFATTHYDINPARVYLTGLSCGGIGAWGYLGQYLDEQIAAMVPIAGDGNGAFAQAGCELGRVPIWAFHGDADGTVGVNGTIGPITALQMCEPKPDAEMVIYPMVGHDSWTMTYDLSAGHDIYAWFLARTKP